MEVFGMKFGICSFSFHRLLESGKQDIFKYITDCKELGMTQLDPWNAHFAPLYESTKNLKARAEPANMALSAEEVKYLTRVKQAADAVGLPFGCIAADKIHIYESTSEARRVNRSLAYKWINIADKLDARQLRIDAGSVDLLELSDKALQIIVEGYADLIARAGKKGIEILIENHMGALRIPDNVVKVLEAVEGLGLLFDSLNWAKGKTEEGWQKCARYARAVHIKTQDFDGTNATSSAEIANVIKVLMDAGYDNCWTVESYATKIDEYEAVKNTLAVIKRTLSECSTIREEGS
jgi:sugar phosphate isomerase/epimerase